MLTYIVIDESLNEVESFIETAANIGVDELEFKTNHFWPNDRKLAIYEKIVQIIKLKSNYAPLKLDVEKPKTRNVEATGDWPLLWMNGVIEANGDLYPCCHTSPSQEWNLGNTLMGVFSDAWYGERRIERLRDVQNLTDGCPTCLDSPYNHVIQKSSKKLVEGGEYF